MNRRDFQRLAEVRRLDALALFRAKRYDAAYYLAGYAVECALKACVAKLTKRYDFPPRDTKNMYTHALETLTKEARIAKQFEHDRNGDSVLAKNWETVKDWGEERRYQLRGRSGAAAARDFLKAINDSQHGVFRCISKYW